MQRVGSACSGLLARDADTAAQPVTRWHNGALITGCCLVEFRRWLPYRSLQSRHLLLALATARVVAWLGMLLVAAGVAYAIATAVSRSGPAMLVALGVVINMIGMGLMALLASGALAALVGIEESHRRQLERD